MTIYKDIEGFPYYRVGDDGTVWSTMRSPTWKRLRPSISGRGHNHHKVIITRDRKHFHRYVHHLVLEAFVGKCPDGLEACHKNDNGFDNRLENLRWDTRSANRIEGYRNGANKGGAKHYRAKLSEDNARDLIAMIDAGKSNQEIAQEFGVTRGAVNAIRKGRNWKHLIEAKKVAMTYKEKKLAEEKDFSTKVFLVWFTTGMSCRKVGDLFNISSGRVEKIVDRARLQMRYAMNVPERPNPPWWKRLKAAGALPRLDNGFRRDPLTSAYYHIDTKAL